MSDEDSRINQEKNLEFNQTLQSLQQPQTKQFTPSNEEVIYSRLNKAMSNIFRVIWILVWPLGVIFAIILCWLGYNTHIRIGQIDTLKQDLMNKGVEVSDMVSRIQMSRIELNEKQDEIKRDQEKLSEEIQKQMNEIAKLGKSTADTTRRGNTLIEKVEKARSQAETTKKTTENLLVKNQIIIDEQIKFVELNKNKIADQLTNISKNSEKLITEVKTNTDDEFERNKKIVSLFVEYQILVTKGRSIFPDPNLNAELKLLDQVALLLYPDSKERNEFIQKINAE